MVKTTIDEIKKLFAEKQIILGSNEILRRLKNEQLKKICLASNAPAEKKEDINYYSSVAGIEVENLEYPNDELGMLLKRMHPVSAIGIIK